MPRASPRAQNLSCIICYILFFLPAEPLGLPFHRSSSAGSFDRTEGKGSEYADLYPTSHQSPYIILRPPARSHMRMTCLPYCRSNQWSSIRSLHIAPRTSRSPIHTKYVTWTSQPTTTGDRPLEESFPRIPARKAIFRLGVHCAGVRMYRTAPQGKDYHLLDM